MELVDLPDVEIQFSDEIRDVLEPHQDGQLTIREAPGGAFEFDAVVRSDASPEDVEGFRQWAQVALAQLVESGDPAANGFYPSTVEKGRWYMTMANHQVPRL